MKQPATIKVPYGLAGAIVHRPMERRAISTFLVLKMVSHSGTIKDFTSCRDQFAKLCRISSRTLHQRIRDLESLGLARKTRGSLELRSYDHLLNLIGHRSYNRWHHIELNWNPEDILRALTEKENITKQHHAVWAKWNECLNPGCKSEVKVDLHRLQQLQIDAFQTGKRFFADHINPFITITQNKRSKLYGLGSYQGGQYWEKKLSSIGLITVRSIPMVLSEKRVRRSLLGPVIYYPVQKATRVVIPKIVEVQC